MRTDPNDTRRMPPARGLLADGTVPARCYGHAGTVLQECTRCRAWTPYAGLPRTGLCAWCRCDWSEVRAEVPNAHGVPLVNVLAKVSPSGRFALLYRGHGVRPLSVRLQAGKVLPLRVVDQFRMDPERADTLPLDGSLSYWNASPRLCSEWWVRCTDGQDRQWRYRWDSSG